MKKFLIIQTAFIGDVILATSIIEKLAAFYPEAQIDFLLRKGNENLLQNNPHINEVVIWDKKAAKYVNLIKTVRKIRKTSYDYVINVHRFATSGLITRFSKAQYKIGYDKNPASKHFHYVIPHKIGSPKNSLYPHEVDRCLKLVEMITDEEFVGPKIYPSEDDWSRVEEYHQEDFITISPISVWETKQYPHKKWVLFCDSIDKKVFLLGGPDDKSRCAKIIEDSENENIVNLAGDLSLLQSAALMSKAKMNYVNDSAPMHLCSAMNAPVTVVYCSTVKEFGFGPISENSNIVEIREELSCRPCGLHGYKACPEGHFKCALNIHTDQLIKPLRELS